MDLLGRQKLALDHSRSHCIIAGAGTGKTQVLVEKYVDLLEKVEGLHVSNILALTFTQKAASEMKERIRDSLAERSQKRWKDIRDEFIWADISTFHSFCTGVLRQFPTETGIEPNFIVLEEFESKQLLEEALESCIHSADPTTGEAVSRLLRDSDIGHVRNCIRELYNKRIFAEEHFKKLDLDDDAIIEDWRSHFEAPQEELSANFRADINVSSAISDLKLLASMYKGDKDSGMIYLRNIEAYLLDLETAESSKAIFSAIVGLFSIKGNRRMGSAKNWDKSDLELLRTSYSELLSFFDLNKSLLDLNEDDKSFMRYTIGFLRDLRTVFHGFIEAADELKRHRGAIDFSDMLFATYRLFKDRKDIVLSHFHNKYRYILVDEFQDTDSIQCMIIWMILGDLSNKSERLFVVGDPKQSIYMFRDADVTLFKEAQNIIEKGLEGRITPLDINFRSSPEIIRFVNYLFSGLFAESSKPWEFGYDPIVVSDGRKKDSGSVELLLAHSAAEKQQGPKIEAEIVARRVQSLIEIEKKPIYWNECGKRLSRPRSAQYSDVAILLQRRTNLRFIEWAFQRYGIPYHVYGGLGFFEQQEIIDIFNLLRFLDNELDDVALYGILRSPYFGVPDTQLYRIMKSSGGSLWWRFQQYSRQLEDPNINQAAQLLDEWLELSQRVPITDLLRRIVRDSGIYAVYGGLDGGDRLVANLEKFLQIASSTQAHGFAPLSRFVEELKILIDEAPMEGEAQVDMETGNAVKIMTVHASKGLEFPIVVIPDMGGKGRDDHHRLMVDETYGIGLKVPDPASNYELRDTFFRKLLKHNHDDKIKAERKRLFYVAATRAKDHLILCGSLPDEFPPTLDEGKTWLDWTAICLGLCEEKINNGFVKIEWPPGSSEFVSIPIICNSDCIRAEIREKSTSLIYVPETFVPKDLPESLQPLRVEDQEHIFSVSEIESYIQCPQRYYHIYKIGRFDQNITSSAIGENAVTKGLIIHEILQGMDPAVVLRSYGISDPKKEELYKGMKKIFMSSEMMSDITEDHKELPFLIEINNIQFAGKIDRLIKKADGSWNIIDYKTTEVPIGEVEKHCDENYSLQLTVYRNGMEQLLDRKVRSFIYFTSLGKFIEVKGDEDRILENIKKSVEKMRAKQFLFETCADCRRKHEFELE